MLKLGLGISLTNRIGAGGGAAPFAFADLYANGEDGFIYDPSQSGLSDGDPVTGATDRINSNDASQATAANQPTYDLTDGVHSFQTDGVDDWLRIPNFPIGSDFTAIFSLTDPVQDQAGISVLRPLFSAADTSGYGPGSNYYGLEFTKAGGVRFSINGDTVEDTYTPDGSATVLTFRKEGTSAKIFRDGVEIASGTLSTTSGFATGDYALFANGSELAGGRAAKTDLYHAMIIDRALTAQEQADAEALSATFAVPTTNAPEITAEPVPQSSPIIGEAMLVDPATATGDPGPTITYQYTRDGSDISGADALEYTPVNADYGTDLGIDTTVTNGVTPDATASTAVGTVAATFEEKFLYDDDANLPKFLFSGTNWDVTTLSASWNLVVSANSPTGRACQIDPVVSSTEHAFRADINDLLASAASPAANTDYVEFLYIIEVNDSQNRTWFKPGGQSGFNIRLGNFYHQISTDDVIDAAGFDLGNFVGQTVVVRHRMEMPDQTKIKAWDITNPEPTDWQSIRTNNANFTAFDLRLGIRQDGGNTSNDIWYVSIGANTAPPEDAVFDLIAPTGVDNMAYAASTDDGATSSLTINNDVTFEFEDNA